MDPKAFGVTYATGEDLRSTWEDVPVRCGVLCAYEFLIFVGNMASFLSRLICSVCIAAAREPPSRGLAPPDGT